MRKGNCILTFQGNNFLNRERLLYGVLVNGYKSKVFSDCNRPRYVDNPIHNYFQNSNVVLPEDAYPKEVMDYSKPKKKEVDYEYVQGMLWGESFYILGKSYQTQALIFPRGKIFIPDITNKKILQCWIQLVLKHGMIQRRQLFFRQDGKRSPNRRNYRLPCAMRLVDVVDIKIHYYKQRGLTYERQKEVVEYPFIEKIPLTKQSVSLLVQWLLQGEFTMEEINAALIGRFGIEISTFLNKDVAIGRVPVSHTSLPFSKTYNM